MSKIKELENKVNVQSKWIMCLVVAVLIIGICLFFIHHNSHVYETRIIELNNTNIYEEIKVVDYVCDEGVKVDNWFGIFKSFYASTWELDSNGGYGRCMLKIRK